MVVATLGQILGVAQQGVVVAVDLPRPRSHEMVAAKEFGALFDRTFHLIREEVTKTMAQQDALEAR